jgi:hypothetical protein
LQTHHVKDAVASVFAQTTSTLQETSDTPARPRLNASKPFSLHHVPRIQMRNFASTATTSDIQSEEHTIQLVASHALAHARDGIASNSCPKDVSIQSPHFHAHTVERLTQSDIQFNSTNAQDASAKESTATPRRAPVFPETDGTAPRSTAQQLNQQAPQDQSINNSVTIPPDSPTCQEQCCHPKTDAVSANVNMSTTQEQQPVLHNGIADQTTEHRQFQAHVANSTESSTRQARTSSSIVSTVSTALATPES